ncbi:MAG: flavin monoamine oxidase family protein [Candidatus Babeliales bacterium]
MKKLVCLVSIVSFFVCASYYEKLPLYKSQTPRKKVVIIGAGIAGLTTAYELHKKGYDVEVYEARGRVGGRMFSALVQGKVVELGGENITDGGSADHLRALINELGLTLEKFSVMFKHAFYHEDRFLPIDEDLKQQFSQEALKEKLEEAARNARSMREVLDQLFVPGSPVHTCLSTRLAGYEGAAVERLSSLYIQTLYYMILGGICAVHPDNETACMHIKGGNSKLPQALADKLGNRVHCSMPLVSLTKEEQQYLLTFKDGAEVAADMVVLAMPCPVYNDITFGADVMNAEKLAAIRSIQNGDNAKIIVPLSAPYDQSTIFVHNDLGIFSYHNFITTLYFASKASHFLPATLDQTYENVKPFVHAALGKHAMPEEKPVLAQDALFEQYEGPVGHSWPCDPYAQGSYAFIASGQEKLMTTLQEYKGRTIKALFAPVDGTLYFAGEHASTLLDVPGTMEAGCQSGILVASLIEKEF